jgi:hypothetical protein
MFILICLIFPKFATIISFIWIILLQQWPWLKLHWCNICVILLKIDEKSNYIVITCVITSFYTRAFLHWFVPYPHHRNCFPALFLYPLKNIERNNVNKWIKKETHTCQWCMQMQSCILSLHTKTTKHAKQIAYIM